MSLAFFESVVLQAKAFTREIACHVVGDPLTLGNLREYLDVLHRHQMRAILTTSGYFMKKHTTETLFHPALKQINISLNAFNKNDTRISFEQYMEPILALVHQKVQMKKEIFINLRIWNLDEVMSEAVFNQKLFRLLEKEFDCTLDLQSLNPQENKSLRLVHKVRLHFDHYFEWPSLENPLYGHGSCQGLDSHIGILANGDVVPCCLDSEGVMLLGNLTQSSLEAILQTKRAQAMRKGFSQGVCSEEMCLRCAYKDRFNQPP